MRALGDAAEYVMQVVRDYGFDPSESSRLAQMRNLLRKGFIRETDSAFDLACEALRDIAVLEFAFDQLRARVPQDDLRGKIARLVKDSALPQADQSSTPGRDAQAELHVAAVCQAAGLNPMFKEPDVVAQMDGQPYGLAVKRLKSLSQLEKRFREAAHQIRHSRAPGFVVLDMVLAANPENERLSFVVSDADFFRMESARFDGFLKRNQGRFRTWREGWEVRGVIVHDHVVCPVDRNRKWGLRSWTVFTDLDPFNDGRRKEAHRFWERYSAGFPNQ